MSTNTVAASAVLGRRTFLHGITLIGLSTLSAPAVARQSDESKVTLADFNILRPSQGAVGMREVAAKTAELLDRARKPDKFQRFLVKEALPVIKGPNGGLHVIDHHHFGRALWEVKRVQVHVETVADLSSLPAQVFWAEMEKRGWLHAFDGNGKLIGPDGLPRYLKDMTDDVYRSLAGSVRSAGGYAKTDVPFAEFKWANFLRTRVEQSLVVRDFAGAVQQSLVIAGGREASGLPGYKAAFKKAG